jgi:hypothetical protein
LSRPATEPGAPGNTRAERSRASARLGLTLRTVLLAPREGFDAAAKAAERRLRAGRRPVEGFSSYVLAAAGGASLAALWLKVGGLFKLRQVCTDGYVGPYIALTLVVGALLALVAQAAWGLVGPPVVKNLRGSATRSQLRLVWGAAALPQVFVLCVLLPLDLLIVGTSTFTTDPLRESLSTAWAAFSIAVAISLGIWSIYLMFRGVEVIGEVPGRRALLATSLAGLCLVLAMSTFVVPTMFVTKETACPTRLK